MPVDDFVFPLKLWTPTSLGQIFHITPLDLKNLTNKVICASKPLLIHAVVSYFDVNRSTSISPSVKISFSITIKAPPLGELSIMFQGLSGTVNVSSPT